MANQNKTIRPQEPQPPYPYHAHDVTYENKSANTTLSGTLTVPNGDGPFPAVLLIAGMGPMDRDGTFNDHKPLLVLADYLARHGIAVLRFDKRGVGSSTGTFDTTVTSADLASDVAAGVTFLKTGKEINPKKIGLIGHSEGGFIAAMVTAQSPDISFVVLMSGAIANKTDELVAQVTVQMRADGASEKIIAFDGAIRKQILETIKRQPNAQKAEQQLRSIFADCWSGLPETHKQEAENFLFAFSQTKIDGQINMMNSPWYRFLLSYDAPTTLAKIRVPLLVLNGEFDFMAPHIVFPIIRTAMERASNKNYTLHELPRLNHSFQTCKTGALAEYATIEETLSPIALQVITEWILAKTTKG